MFLRGELRCKCEDITATAAARIVGVNRKTVNSYYNRIRELIFEESLKEAGKEFGRSFAAPSSSATSRISGQGVCGESAAVEPPGKRRCSGF